MPVDYSVIIVTYNSAAWVGECLDSLMRQQGDCARLELIVVDNASTDDTVAILRSAYPDLTILRNERNLGFAAAVNQGVKAAGCSRLLFLNPDSRVEPGFFSGLERFFDEYPGPSIVGCRLKGSDGSPQASCWKTPGLWTTLLESSLPYEFSVGLVTENPSETRQVETVSGACMMVGREDFLRLGRFDERFFMYYEDFDLCIRARRAGIPVYYVPGASVVHHVRKSTERAGEMFFLYVYQSKLRILQKHESGAAYLLAYLIIVAGILIRIPAYAVAGTLFAKQELLHLSKYHTLVLPKIAAALFSRQRA